MDFKKFDDDFEKEHQRFNIMFNITSIFIGLVWLAMIVSLAFGIHQISKYGLKGVIEKVWNGRGV